VALAEQVVADLRWDTGRTIEVTAEGSALVLGDEDALARVLGNLIDNAAKYSLRNAPIEVRVADEEGEFGPVAFVEVADRGPGIPDDELPRVIEPFARLDRDADTPGSGLGLSIAHDVTQGHDGRLTFTAREGGGTVARIEFPRT
jgi:two-component system sensor histidine kinase TctE